MRKAMILGLALAGIALTLPEPAAAAPRWGPLSLGNCTGCDRKYSAILWDIPWGQDWSAACRNTPHPQLGMAKNCVNNGANMWGEWFRCEAGGCGTWCKC